ncbi:hypothetical protein GOP47_0023268 [Adiantum capillus-veneris]|uniref:Pentatricopeptide repeat-containing protein n=1 Tax=Adiantum capillus-veneris TaxID=13818 RepID=A0A9D4U8Y7_ADICA|nr:hypothetical protein GOP47_0023268 [Adiantum capillus-veneris]
MLSRAFSSGIHGFFRFSTKARWLSTWAELPIEDLESYTPLLRTCQVLSHAHHLHLLVAQYGYDTIFGMQKLLLHMYGKCGALAETCTLFAKMHTHVVFSWNLLIHVYARGRNVDMAFQVFQQMWQHELEPNKFTLVSILSVCTNASVLVVGKLLHSCIIMNGCEGDLVVDTAIVNMYSKCGDLKSAIVMFEKMHTHNVYSWSAMLAAYAQHGKGEDAVWLFYVMQHQGELPNSVTFISLLDACACLRALDIGQRVRARILGTDVEQDVVVATAVVNMYAKCNLLKEAHQVFDNIRDPNVTSWNTLIAAYAQHGKGLEALQSFFQMQEKGIDADQGTFVSVIDACTGILALEEGEYIHGQLLARGFLPHVIISTALVNMYGKCNSLAKAREVFEGMPYKNIVTWNTVIAVHAQQSHFTRAFEYLNQMQWEGLIPDKVTFVSTFDVCAKVLSLADGKRLHTQIIVKEAELDVAVGTAIINMYGKCGATEEARSLFDRLPEKNSITFSSMIATYAHLEQWDAAFQMYGRLHEECIIPDMVSCICVLDMCADMAALKEGEQVHAEIVMEAYELDEAVGTALISLYGRCGSLEAAEAVFARTPSQSAVTWNALIAGFAQHGKGRSTLQLFYQMQETTIRPTDATFISVLNACSHTGLVSEGHHFFNLMSQKYGIKPSADHYGCMVDLFGRAGMLDEAESLIYDMPDQPTIVTWMSLLGACRHQADLERGERAAEILFRLDPENVAWRVILSNMYAVNGMEEGTIMIANNDEDLQEKIYSLR